MAQDKPWWSDEVFADLDRSGPVPLWFQIATRLQKAITSGEIPAGTRLENEISIGERLGLSRPTVRRAIQELVDKGLVVRRRGIGTQVVQGAVSRPVELTSLYDDMQRGHLSPVTEVLAHETVPAPERVAEQLGLKTGDDVVRLRRLRSTGDVPVAVMENYLPPDVADFSTEELTAHGLYELMRKRRVTIKVAQQRIGARRVHAEESRLLDLEKGAPVLTMERTAFDASGRAVEYGHHCYRPDMYTFETSLVAK
ncbi:MAG: GntR family transcriptional regulator [Galactobacter sp.]